ncbi:hypothetical protein KP509_24G032200 [Ceratopteris richardii]|uniref:Uncharacterized protein n=1 Tax=Ceratopteris richardii TaxID=49495 RepID=A0A8T2RW49_CERRI|nr:hypothetical protein KP509_24G032200 [Ceratopteris richardii]
MCKKEILRTVAGCTLEVAPAYQMKARTCIILLKKNGRRRERIEHEQNIDAHADAQCISNRLARFKSRGP